MVKDQCITVSEADKILGHASKYDVHRFSQEQPQGVLHRAFSVFLFDSQNRLLLQQRAAGKITFPNVWTNTCCSHPLYGQEPPEVDTAKAIAAGTVEVRNLQAGPSLMCIAIRCCNEDETGTVGIVTPLERTATVTIVAK